MMAYSAILIQITAAVMVTLVCVLLILYVFDVNLVKSDKELPYFKRFEKHVAVPIDGVLPFSYQELRIDAHNKNSDWYMYMPKSSNIKGGAQYSYSFWMNKNKLVGVKDKVILLRGLKNVHNTVTLGEPRAYPSKDTLTMDGTHYVAQVQKEVATKSPMIKFGANEDEIIVQFNTVGNRHNEFKITSDILNVMGTNNWVMYTFTFEDFIAPYGFENGVVAKFFINDKEVFNKKFKYDALAINDGPLFVFPYHPNEKPEDRNKMVGSIADLKYYNYALTAEEIRDIKKKGFNKQMYIPPHLRKELMKKKYYQLSVYNQIDQL
jgi:hypothetical protein